MAERDDDDQKHVVGDRVDDAVVPDAHAQAGSPAQGTRGRRTWVVGEERDRALDAVAGLRIELAQ